MMPKCMLSGYFATVALANLDLRAAPLVNGYSDYYMRLSEL